MAMRQELASVSIGRQYADHVYRVSERARIWLVRDPAFEDYPGGWVLVCSLHGPNRCRHMKAVLLAARNQPLPIGRRVNWRVAYRDEAIALLVLAGLLEPSVLLHWPGGRTLRERRERAPTPATQAAGHVAMTAEAGPPDRFQLIEIT